MSEPIVFISHSRVKQGKLEAFKDLARETIPLIERGKPGTVVFLGYTRTRTAPRFTWFTPSPTPMPWTGTSEGSMSGRRTFAPAPAEPRGPGPGTATVETS
jgi:hypothetical protein